MKKWQLQINFLFFLFVSIHSVAQKGNDSYSVKNAEYTIPLRFEVTSSDQPMPALEFDYEMSKDGQSLRISSLFFDSKSFSVELMVPAVKDPGIAEKLRLTKNPVLFLSWPQVFLKYPKMEVLSKTGSVVWSIDLDSKKLSEFDNRKKNWAQSLSVDERNASSILKSTYVIENLKTKKAPFWNSRGPFRFCLSAKEGRAQTKMCSPQYGIRLKDGNIELGLLKGNQRSPRVLIMNEEAPLAGRPAAVLDMPFMFYADMSYGASLEFIGKPNPLFLADISADKNSEDVLISGFHTQPLGDLKILNPEEESYLVRLLGWQETIGDLRKFWQIKIKRSEAYLDLPGQGAGLFRQRLLLQKIPTEAWRTYAHKETLDGTYVDGAKIFLRKNPKLKITSQENQIESGKESSEVVWRIQAKKRGELNKSYVNLSSGSQEFRSYYEIYKGYPREFSFRLTGTAQLSGGITLLGESAFNYWFEDIAGSTNYLFSRQRWGLSAKYFRSLTPLEISTSTGAKSNANFDILVGDIKYRFSRGLWARDESWGAIGSFQRLNYDVISAPMLGVGIFWARSMPRIFDQLFNIVPIMRYPKWVDAEFIQYFNSLNSDVSLGNNFALNFHGKVLWSQDIFGEAGFGLKQYSVSDKTLNKKAGFTSFYGTVGLGVNF